jgi:hypothetical protein
VGARCAGRFGGVVQTPGAEHRRHVAARGVDERVGQPVRRDALPAALIEDGLLAQRVRQPAHDAADDDAEPLGVVHDEVGIPCRLHRRRHAEVHVARGAPHLLGAHRQGGVEVLHLGCDVDREGVRVERADEVDPAPPGHQRIPRGSRIVAEGGDRADASDGHSPHRRTDGAGGLGVAPAAGPGAR